jgi:hypothetical protein
MASREEDKAMGGLLRRSLARDTVASQDCPQADILAAYYERSLDADETSHCELHFSQCARCRQLLAAMVRANEPASQTEHAAKAWSWFFNPWMLVPAAAAVALAILISVRLAPVAYKSHGEAVEIAKTVQPPTPTIAPTPSDALSEDKAAPSGALKSPAPSAKVAPGSSQPAPNADYKMVAPSVSLDKQEKRAPGTTAASGHASLSKPAQAAPQAQESENARAGSARTSGTANAASAAPDRVASGFGAGVAPRATVQAQNQGEAGQQVAQAQSPPPAPANARARNEVQAQSSPQKEDGKQAETESVVVEDQVTSAELAAKQKVPRATALNGNLSVGDTSRLRTAEERSTEKIIRSPDANVMWRISSSNFVELSRDGGATWNGGRLDSKVHLLAGTAPTRKVCWLVGLNGAIFTTRDGHTWKKVTPPANLDFVSVTATDDGSADITASDGRVFATDNGGKIWRSVQ